MFQILSCVKNIFHFVGNYSITRSLESLVKVTVKYTVVQMEIKLISGKHMNQSQSKMINKLHNECKSE
jgi:hypothetical protein